jgi:hypothetical protein
MDLSPEGKTVCVGKSAQAFIRPGGKVGKTTNLVALSFQENLLGRLYDIRTAIRHR